MLFRDHFWSFFHLHTPKSALNIDWRQKMKILPLNSWKMWPFMCKRPFMKIYISCTFWPSKLKIVQNLGQKKSEKTGFFDFFSISPQKKLASIGCLGKGLRCGGKKINFSKEKMDFWPFKNLSKFWKIVKNHFFL